MLRPALLLAAALLAGSNPVAAKTAPKPAAKAAAPPAKGAAAPQGRFDARNPASLTALLATMSAKAEVARTTEDGVELSVATPSFSFGAQYSGCGPNKTGCQALAFTTSSDRRRVNLEQVNAFNQTSLTCRVFQDRTGKPHVMYATLVFDSDGREAMRTHLGVWQGCLASFGAFLADPPGYLAAAP